MNPLEQAVEEKKRLGSFRHLIEGRDLIDFSSNDYLGLSRSTKIRERLRDALAGGCPLGSTGSRLLSGTSDYQNKAELFLASTFGFESALLFSSGYLANLGVLSALAEIGAEFFSDELNHSSLVSGMTSAKNHRRVFRHNDLGHLEELLSRSHDAFKVIVTETVFSMDGDLSPLYDVLKLAKKFGAWVVLDEAHATGVFGLRGLGRFDDQVSYDVKSKVICVHTGGKALGAQGAFVLSSQVVRDFLINYARSFIFSTALSPLSCLHLCFAVEEILSLNKGPELLQAAAKFRSGLNGGIQSGQSDSPIVPIILGSNGRSVNAATLMQKRGFDVRAIRHPTVAFGKERIRITLKSFHLPDQLKSLLDVLNREVCK